MKTILETRHGVTFHPKERPIRVPIIDNDRLQELVLPQDKEDLAEWISYLTDYLEGQAIFDKWGMNDAKRNAWRKKMYDQYGEVFIDVYTRPNQLTRASMSSVGGTIYSASAQIEGKTGDSLLTRNLRGEAARLRAVLTGYHIVPIEDRLEIVRIHEGVALDTLRRIFGVDHTRPMMIT